MQLSGNTVLITGGGSGIGLAMAEEFQRLGNKIIVAGRSVEKLKKAAAKGLETIEVDMVDSRSIRDMANQAIERFPSLNVIIHNAGVMKNEQILKGGDSAAQDETVATNLLGPMRLTSAMLPHLRKQTGAVIMTVSSGLAFAPLAMTPTYSATKAAIHSYTQSLRYQLKDTSIQVIELVPPYVQTHLMGQRQSVDPNAMPLAEFITEVFQNLREQPDAREILVKRVHPQRLSADGGPEEHEAFFMQMNDRVMAARRDEWES